jgi:hypothetical protein
MTWSLEERRDVAGVLLSQPEKPLPSLWKEFDAMARVPLMVIRGGNSDVLSEATVAAMQPRHPAMMTVDRRAGHRVAVVAAAGVVDRAADHRRAPGRLPVVSNQ